MNAKDGANRGKACASVLPLGQFRPKATSPLLSAYANYGWGARGSLERKSSAVFDRRKGIASAGRRNVNKYPNQQKPAQSEPHVAELISRSRAAGESALWRLGALGPC